MGNISELSRIEINNNEIGYSARRIGVVLQDMSQVLPDCVDCEASDIYMRNIEHILEEIKYINELIEGNNNIINKINKEKE